MCLLVCLLVFYSFACLFFFSFVCWPACLFFYLIVCLRVCFLFYCLPACLFFIRLFACLLVFLFVCLPASLFFAAHRAKQQFIFHTQENSRNSLMVFLGSLPKILGAKAQQSESVDILFYLFVCLLVCFYLFVCLLVCLLACFLFMCLFACLCVCLLAFYLCVCLPACVFACLLFIYVFVCLLVCLLACFLFMCLFACLCVFLLVCPAACVTVTATRCSYFDLFELIRNYCRLKDIWSSSSMEIYFVVVEILKWLENRPRYT